VALVGLLIVGAVLAALKLWRSHSPMPFSSGTMFDATGQAEAFQNPTYVGQSYESTNPLYTTKASGPAGQLTKNPLWDFPANS